MRKALTESEAGLYGADGTGQPKLSQAAALLKLLQSHSPALSPFAQALSRPGPGPSSENGRTSATMGLLSPAPYDTDVATSDQQDLWLSSAPTHSSFGMMPVAAADCHNGGMQVNRSASYGFPKPSCRKTVTMHC